MKMSFSPHVAFQVVRLDEAVDFYRDILGMELIETTDVEVVLKSGPMTFHVEERSAGTDLPTSEAKTFFEFETDDLDEARRRLDEKGCRIVDVQTPEGQDSLLVEDPYGFHFHVFQP